MPTAAIIPSARRTVLIVQALGKRGQVVVKDPRTGPYYNLGEEESFLLGRLDGRATLDAICAEFAGQFHESLKKEDLQQYLALAEAWGLLETGAGTTAEAPSAPPRRRQSWLAWRYCLFDPDRLFSVLEPKLRFFWTPGFLVISAGCIGAAAVQAGMARHELAQPLAQNMRWEVLVLAWLMLLAVTTMHEFAHGLTCKHHGGEVHEVGVILLFFLPGLYCNVSDSWLMPEKSKRIWVTLAGGYFELFLWSLAVFTWLLTVVGSLANRLAWSVVSVSGVRVFFNFNPLLKLDGYYMLSDLIEIPNLRQRSWTAWLGHLRWLLWGAARPAREPKGCFLLGLGTVSWCFSVVLIAMMVFGMTRWMLPRGGWITMGACAGLGGLVLHVAFRGFLGQDVAGMIAQRRRRAAAWVVGPGALPAVLALGGIEHRQGGTFTLRPAQRRELRAPVAGFQCAVYFDQGDRVSPATLVAMLEQPELETKRAQKQAELREAQAVLRALEIGARPGEVAEQRRRVERAEHWLELGRLDLGCVRIAHRENLQVLRHKVAQGRAERQIAFETFHCSVDRIAPCVMATRPGAR
jgi:putative peptide zinc metalloprotease protein